MGSLRSQAQFESARWRLVILAPIWAFQMLLTLSLTGVFAWRLGDTFKFYSDRERKGELPKLEVAWEATNMGLAAVSTACTLFEIAKYFGESLTPWTMLFTHVIKLTCALGILVLDIIVLLDRTDTRYTIVSLAIDVTFLIISLALVAYTIYVFRRLSALESHHHTLGVKSFGFRDGDGLERGDSQSNPFGSGFRQTVEKGRSSMHRLSLGSRPDDVDPVPLEEVERRHSLYSHERDTQFDDYVARRGSTGGASGIVVTPPSDSEENGVTAFGQVNSRARGMSMPRDPSWASDHVLVSVPEEDDEHAAAAAAAAAIKETKADEDKKDRQGLLNDDERRHSHDDDLTDATKVPQDVDVVEPKWARQ